MISFASVAANCGTAHANAGRGDGLPRKDRRVYSRHPFAWRVQRDVTLSCSGGPTGATCVDFPMKVPVNPTRLAISGILFPLNAQPGVYRITFIGVSGPLTGTATATFTVK